MKYDKYKTEDFLKDEFFITSMIDSDSEGFWDNWTKSSPTNLGAYELAKQIIESMGYKELKYPQETDYEEVMKNVLAMDRDIYKSGNHSSKPKVISFANAMKLAASVALLLASIWVWNQYALDSHPNHQDQEIALVSKTTLPGQKNTVKLSDGSKVILNSGGKITYRKNFTEKKRKIELIGEAYFEVAKDANRPFVVSTRGICTKALGTSFNIRAFEDESNVIISLVTGKVSVGQTEGFDVVLNPGDQLNYNTEENIVEQNLFDESRILAWTRGIMVFENASMEEVIKELEKWYGVTFELENLPKKDWNYSGRFENQSLTNVLENLSYSQGFQYDLKGKIVKLKF